MRLGHEIQSEDDLTEIPERAPTFIQDAGSDEQTRSRRWMKAVAVGAKKASATSWASLASVEATMISIG